MKKLFIFEFATCLGDLPDSIAVEGLAMFKSMLNFSKYYSLVSGVKREFQSVFRFPQKSFEDCLKEADVALIVAPENDFTLYELTKKVEEFGVENLGAESEAVKITSDKYELYKKLRKVVKMPKTSLSELEGKYVVKPRVSCGGENIRIGGEVPENFVAQEFVEGKPISASYLAINDVILLSVNEQILEGFEYRGAIVPFEVDKDLEREIEEIGCRVAEKIKGLKGYFGIDFVLGEELYLIEVNARLTTPSILFEFSYGKSLADMMEEFKKEGKVSVKKLGRFKLYKGSGEGYVTYKNYAIKVERL